MGIGHFVGPWGVGLFFALERSRLSLGDQDQPRVPNKQFSYRILWTSLLFSASMFIPFNSQAFNRTKHYKT